jgi:site-specific recombinase XerD
MGLDLKDIQKILRHSNLNTTGIYADVSDEDLDTKYNDIMAKQNTK